MGAKQLSLFGNGHRAARAMAPGVANRNEVYKQVRGSHTSSQLQILELLEKQPNGATIDEAAKLLGKTPNQISGRFSELSKVGAIENRNGLKRRTTTGHNACVWFVR